MQSVSAISIALRACECCPGAFLCEPSWTCPRVFEMKYVRRVVYLLRSRSAVHVLRMHTGPKRAPSSARLLLYNYRPLIRSIRTVDARSPYANNITPGADHRQSYAGKVVVVVVVRPDKTETNRNHNVYTRPRNERDPCVVGVTWPVIFFPVDRDVGTFQPMMEPWYTRTQY